MNINQLLNTVLLNETEEINESDNKHEQFKLEQKKPYRTLNSMDSRNKPTPEELALQAEKDKEAEQFERAREAATGGKGLSAAQKAGLYGTAGLGAGLGALYLAKKLREKRAAKKAKK